MASTVLVVPGFCDLQVNGFAGVDFNDPATAPEDVARAAAAMEATGVTSFLPTLISSDLVGFAACAKRVLSSGAPGILGLHMEGPYIASDEGPRGAHDPAAMTAASPDDFARRQDAADGMIRLVTLAPEVPGVLDLIDRLVGSGVRVAIGHTAASPETIVEAVRRGATLSTHLGNAAHLMLPRHPNYIWEQLAQDELWTCLIADGFHLPDQVLKVVMKVKGERAMLVRAAMPGGQVSVGSGTLLGDGLVLTAAHVVFGDDGRALPGVRAGPPEEPELVGASVVWPDRYVVASGRADLDAALLRVSADGVNVVPRSRISALPARTVKRPAADFAHAPVVAKPYRADQIGAAIGKVLGQ